MRVVLDTNTYISSLLIKEGPLAQIIDSWRALRYDLVTSPAIIAEVIKTASYPRIRRKYAITDKDVENLVELLRRFAVVVEPTVDVMGSVPADPDDEIVITCAVGGAASLIVSGDRHLLSLVEYRSIRIITASMFLRELDAAEEVSSAP